MDLPIIIVEFGQQRQRLKLKKFHFTVQELLQLFSRTFHTSFDLQKYDILLFNERLDSITNLDFTQLDTYPRFRIQLHNHQNTSCASDDMMSLKQRLNTVSTELIEVTFLINSIHTNCQNLIKTFTDEETQSNHRSTENLLVPPGFQPLPNYRSSSPRDSQSTDEGIDRDTGSVSIFESAHSDHELESIYVECREDLTIINEPNEIKNKNNNRQFQWRNQPSHSRSHWNSNQVKYQFGEKPRLKKPINPNKLPLPAAKKKNIPCKYAAGGNCKRGKHRKNKI